MSTVRLFESDWHDGMAQVAAREWTEEAARAVAEDEGSAQVDLAWAAVCAAEFVGAGVPTAHGGSGLDLGPVLEIAAAAGAALFPTRLAFESLLPSLILRRLDGRRRAGELLAEIADGGRIGVGLDPRPDRDEPVFVHGARAAPRCIVIRRVPATVLIVERAVLGEVTPVRLLDGREVDQVDLSEADGEVLAQGAAAEVAAAEARWLGALLAAADALGAAASALDRAVVYSGQRRQFGVPIGSFQAVKHAIVDRFIDLQIGRALLAAASEGDDLDPVTAAMAKAAINQASVRAVDTAIQVHGAIGFTAELGLHLYQRRALVDRELFAGTGLSLALVRHALGVDHLPDPHPEPISTGAHP